MTIIPCRVCGGEFEPRSAANIYCSVQCKDKGKPSKRRNRCSACGCDMEGKPSAKSVCLSCRGIVRSATGELPAHGSTGRYGKGCRCEPCRAAQSAYMRDYKERYRAKHGVGPSSASRRRFKEANGYWPQARYGYDIPHRTRRAVYERDAWVCQICARPIPRAFDPQDRLAPALDHIVPRSAQLVPDHSEGNLRMVHNVCNAYRSNLGRSDAEVAALTAEFFASEGGRDADSPCDCVHGVEEVPFGGSAGSAGQAVSGDRRDGVGP